MGDSNDYCYYTVFKALGVDTNTWFVGTSFLQNKYIVYDLSPMDEKDMNYIQVGIGEIN